MKILIAVVGLFIILIVINKLLEAYRGSKKRKDAPKRKTAGKGTLAKRLD